MRWYDSDLGNGVIKNETIVDYLGYKRAIENLQLGVSTSKDAIENIWEESGMVEGDLKIEDIFAEGLEKGRKAAAQE